MHALIKKKPILLFIVIFFTPSPSWTTTTEFSAYDLWPSVGDPYYLTTSSSETLYQKQFFFELSNTYARHPLELLNPTRTERLRSVIDYYIANTVSGGIGIFDIWQVGFNWPIFSQAIYEHPTNNPSGGQMTVRKMGDLRLTSKITLLTADKHRFGIALEPYGIIPFGAHTNYLGESKAVTGARAIVDFLITNRFRLALNLGGEIPFDDVSINNINYKYRFLSGLGLWAKINDWFSASTEIKANTSTGHFFSEQDTTPVEVLGGVKYQLRETGFEFSMGGGSCIVCGVRSANVRAFLNIAYRHMNELMIEKKASRERDMFVTLATEKEKKEFAQIMLNLRHQCPDNPDEFNPEVHDAECPKYYDIRSVEGLLQTCPKPEDFDPSLHDESCPKVFTLLASLSPEEQVYLLTLSESDRDGDHIHDLVDKCPDDPEDINEIHDEDGCPDRGVVVLNDEIKTISPIHFAFGKSDIQQSEAHTLNNMADAIYFHPEINSIEVEGHTDNIGTQESNKVLSFKRAKSVIDYLRMLGVPESITMQATGYGEEKPMTDNETEEGRSKNRRVIFKIEKTSDNNTPPPLNWHEPAIQQNQDLNPASQEPTLNIQVEKTEQTVQREQPIAEPKTEGSAPEEKPAIPETQPTSESSETTGSTPVLIQNNEITLDTKIAFPENQIHIDLVLAEKIQVLADFLREHPEIQIVEILGHPDQKNPWSVQKRLAVQRAYKIKGFLESLQIRQDLVFIPRPALPDTFDIENKAVQFLVK